MLDDGAPDRGGARRDDPLHQARRQDLVRVFPDKPITKKPLETRMGKGKGAPDQWVCVVRPGRILFEMEGVSETDAKRAMQLAAAKLPIKTKFAARFGQESAS